MATDLPMPSIACPVCSQRPGPDWELLSRTARYEEIVASWVCPCCTAICTEHPEAGSIAGQYRARAMAPDSAALLWEDEQGRIHKPTPDHRRALLRDRLIDLRHAVEAIAADSQGEDPDRRPATRLLEVGCRRGSLLATAAKVFPSVAVQGLEPWGPWRTDARGLGLPVAAATLEDWDDEGSFDLIVDLDLLANLADPGAHLRAIAQRLSRRGVALIGAPNLLAVRGELAVDVLRTENPVGFTPRALATACRRAGLMPIQISAGPELRMLCRPAEPCDAVVSGPDVLRVVGMLHGNDLRLTLKRALALTGPTPRLLATAASVHRRCPCPDTRADIAIEVAVSAERCSDYEGAVHWLNLSLEDRRDPEVDATLDQLRALLRNVKRIVTTAPKKTQRPLPLAS